MFASRFVIVRDPVESDDVTLEIEDCYSIRPNHQLKQTKTNHGGVTMIHRLLEPPGGRRV